MEKKLRELLAKWRKEAWAMVPPEYADRNMHGKYLRLDNHAAGLDEAADELEEFLADAGGEPRVSSLSELIAELDDAAQEWSRTRATFPSHRLINAIAELQKVRTALLGSDGKVETSAG